MDAADVNKIVAHFITTGMDPAADRASAQNFGYATSVSFTEAMQNVAEIQSNFNELPSEARKQFDNDPAQWLDAMSTPAAPEADTPDVPDVPPGGPEGPSSPSEAVPSDEAGIT